MSIDFRLPNITATTEEGKLQQVQSYLYQLVEQLNWAMQNIGTGGGSVVLYSKGSSSSTVDTNEKTPGATFNEIKALIIKSAEIVDAYFESINKRLTGMYVAKSDFGTYTEQTNLLINANSQQISQYYNNMQQIISDIEGMENALIEVNAHIHSGLLYYDDSGVPIYGLEIGQRSVVDGAEVFNKFARFTADKLSFYDNNDNEVAYISDKKLYITYVEVTVSFKLGGFVDTVMDDKSVVTKWITGGEG